MCHITISHLDAITTEIYSSDDVALLLYLTRDCLVFNEIGCSKTGSVLPMICCLLVASLVISLHLAATDNETVEAISATIIDTEAAWM